MISIGKRIGIFFLVAGVGVLGVFAFVGEKPATSKQSNHISVTPTPVPFEELTIPYLQHRAYTSTINETTRFQRYPSYTAYTAIYDSDGLLIRGLLTIPNTPPPNGGYPAIVFVHGYIPPDQYKTTERYVEYVDALARAGFVVFKIDLRGHGASDGNPSGAYYSSGYVIDTLNAYAALAANKEVNPKRIGLWGHSMAGNVIMRAFAARPDIPAVVIWAGAGYTYEDLSAYRIQDLSYRPGVRQGGQQNRARLRDVYGDFTDTSPFWRKVAVTQYLADLKGALEIHHAVDDPVVSIEYSRNLMKLLDRTSVRHALYEYPSGGHNISGTSFTSAMNRTIEFYRTNL